MTPERRRWRHGRHFECLVAVAELLQDLLHVIDSRYQGKLYDYWKVTRITQCEVDDANNDE